MREPIVITSRSNPRLARVRKVRDGKLPDEIFVEGRRVVDEIVRSSAELIECVIGGEVAESDFGKTIRFHLDRRNVPVIKVPDGLFRSVSDTVHSQGIALIARRPATGREVVERAFSKERPTLLVCLHQAGDPSNIGAVFRTAEASGATGLIISKDSADAFSAKAIRAGMGANVRVPLWDRAEIGDAMKWARKRRIRVVAADIDGEQRYTEVDWTRPSMIVFGSEAHGLERMLLEMADEVAAIPMKNGVESLNLAVSAGIILFEAVRQNIPRFGY